MRQGLLILLSHRSEDELHLCFKVRLGAQKLHLCARCLGLYPGLFAALIAGRHFGPWPFWIEWGLLFLAPLPALLEWGLTVGAGTEPRPRLVRLLTGLGLGIGLGASLELNTRSLLAPAVLGQLALLLGTVWIAWLASYLRRGENRRARRAQRRPLPSELVLKPPGVQS